MSLSPLPVSTQPTSVASEDDEMLPTVQFTNIRELYQKVDSIARDIDFIIVTHVTPADFRLLEDHHEPHRKLRFRRYDADVEILFVVIPRRLHEVLHLQLNSIYTEKLVHMGLRREWQTGGATTYYERSGNHGGRRSGQGDSTGGPFPERSAEDACPTLVIEAGYSESLQRLRNDMQWWFSASNHGVKIVLLVKFDPRRQEILLEKWEEEPRGQRPGAATTRSMGSLAPVKRQTVTITKDPTSPDTYNVARGALVLSFRLLFLRDPNPGEGDIVFSIQDLEEIAQSVWRALPRS